MKILMVDDNLGDIHLVKQALTKDKACSILYTVKNGFEALAFLRQEGDFTNAPRPDIILLDLNMPRMGGREVLANLKADPNLRQIPVIVWTSSQSDQDVKASYDLHANCYITKPENFHQCMRVLHAIENFWLAIVTLPS